MKDTHSHKKRVLVIQPLPGIGDMVWHMPFIEAIAVREGAADVEVLAIKRSLADQLFAAEGYVAKVHWLDDEPKARSRWKAMLALARKLRLQKYDKVWVLHRDYRWALTSLLAGIPERFGYGLGWQRLFLNRGTYLSRNEYKFHPIDQAVQFLKLNKLVAQEPLPHIQVSRTDASKIETDFRNVPKPWISFGLGATDTRRQWGADNFALLAKQMLSRLGGTVFLIGGAAENEMAERIKNAMAGEQGPSVISLISRPIGEVSALCQVCDLFIGNDSGMLHVSAAVGTPSIGLFGVKYKKIDTYRLADERRNIFAVFPADNADEANVSHMHKISVESVISKVEGLLEQFSEKRDEHGIKLG